MPEASVILSDDLDTSIARYEAKGYRLDMIYPADSPREAQISNGEESLRITLATPAADDVDKGFAWVKGRAGMEYQDIIPGRLGGKVIASHIRLTAGGPVPDYVHYHNIVFQVLYCMRGRINVVYEDQGEPFWFETGDCILQPPGIRHRVLFAEAGAEVVEVTSPAEHETWVDHDKDLPGGTINPDRQFRGQRFHHSRAEAAEWRPVAGGVLLRETGILAASDRLIDVRVFRRPAEINATEWFGSRLSNDKGLIFPIGPGETLAVDFMV